jgi:hypothetical protein
MARSTDPAAAAAEGKSASYWGEGCLRASWEVWAIGRYAGGGARAICRWDSLRTLKPACPRTRAAGGSGSESSSPPVSVSIYSQFQ